MWIPSSEIARCQPLLDEFEPLNLLELALRLRRFRRNGAEAVGERLQVGDFLLLVFVGGQMLLVTLLALAEVVGIISGVGNQLLLGNFVNLRDDLVHELAIM
jgi:hypothetical protein